jgi:hypothetical protein
MMEGMAAVMIRASMAPRNSARSVAQMMMRLPLIPLVSWSVMILNADILVAAAS